MAKAGDLEELAAGLYLVHAPDGARIPHAHSLLALGDRNILVDTGLGPEVISGLRRKHDIGLVLNSHYHRDHAWGNHLFRGVPVLAHELDAPMLNSQSLYFRKMGVTGRSDEAQIKKFTLGFIPHIRGPRVGRFSGGEVFDTGAVQLEAVHLPGHSPGHCGFLHRESRTLFSADICPDAFGPWYGHACSSIETFAASIDRIRGLGPRRLVTGHTAPLERDIGGALRRYKSKIGERDELLLRLLESPRTLPELLALHPLYGGSRWNLKLPFRFWEEVMVRKHLRRLLQNRRIEKEGARYLTI